MVILMSEQSDSETEQQEKQRELAHEAMLHNMSLQQSPPRYEELECFEDGHFPDHWDDEDMDFLADFVRSYFDSHLVRLMGDDGYDYSMFVPAGESDE